MKKLLAIGVLCLTADAAGAAVPTALEAKGVLIRECPGLALETFSRVRCQGFGDDEPTEAVCSYTVVAGGKPVRDETYFAVDANGWHLIDTPGYCPAASRK